MKKKVLFLMVVVGLLFSGSIFANDCSYCGGQGCTICEGEDSNAFCDILGQTADVTVTAVGIGIGAASGNPLGIGAGAFTGDIIGDVTELAVEDECESWFE